MNMYICTYVYIHIRIWKMVKAIGPFIIRHSRKDRVLAARGIYACQGLIRCGLPHGGGHPLTKTKMNWNLARVLGLGLTGILLDGI